MIYKIVLMRGDVYKVEATSYSDAWNKGMKLYPEIRTADISNIIAEEGQDGTKM